MSILSLPALIRGRHIRDDYQMPLTEWQARRKELCNLMEEKQLEGCLIYADSLCNSYVEYFSNYNCVITWSNVMLLVLKDGRTVILCAVPGRDLERVKTFVCEDIEVELIGMSLVANDHVGSKVCEYISSHGLPQANWGAINLDWSPAQTSSDLQALLGELTDLTTDFDEMRLVKSKAEQSLISQASCLARNGCISLARSCQKGGSVYEVAAKVNKELRCAGAEDVEILVGMNSNGGFLRVPDDTVFKTGDSIKVYVEVQYLRYKAVYGATVTVGEEGINKAEECSKVMEIYKAIQKNCVAGKVFDFNAVLPDEWRGSTFTGIYSIGMDLKEPLFSEKGLSEGITISMVLEDPKTGAFLADTMLVTQTGAQSMTGAVHMMEFM